MEYIYDHRKIIQILLREDSGSMLDLKGKKMVQKNMFPLSIMEPIFPIHTDMYVSFLVGGHLEILKSWVKNDCDIPPEEFTTMIYTLMFGGIILANQNS